MLIYKAYQGYFDYLGHSSVNSSAINIQIALIGKGNHICWYPITILPYTTNLKVSSLRGIPHIQSTFDC